ncbi:MAG: HAMP domain-containing sensor histidine kinase [Chloroflexota bacterium]|nr:HAMP domain-containing sensor histidine kinase [Chloroflexota bacterium]
MSLKTVSPHTRSPFVGARPFERADAAWFFGRASEAHELAPLIANQRILMIAGEAKTGKTSLLNTIIAPQLEKLGIETLPTVTFAPTINAPQSEPRNVFAIQTLRRWRRGSAGDWTVERFLDQHPRQINATGDMMPRALIFDQAERLFDSAPHRWRDRDWFIDSLIAALTTDPTLRLVCVIDAARALALREYFHIDDRVSASIFQLWTLGGLYEARALSAIIEPFQRAHPQRIFASGSVEALIAQLSQRATLLEYGERHLYTGETVDLERLQVVCQQLWETLPATVTEIECSHWQPILDELPPLTLPLNGSARTEVYLRAENRRLRKKLARLQHQLDGQRREIDAAELLKAMIVSTVAHEFNTPLLQIKTSIHLLAEDSQRDRETLLRLANDATARLTNQVQNLTQLAETLDIQTQPMVARDSVDQALGSLRRSGMTKNKLDRVYVDFGDRLPLVLGDRKGIGIVLHHLIDNALKFSHETVEVKATHTENSIMLSVSDHGIGIASEYQQRIFDLFFQIDSSVTKKYGGMGVGLAIVRLILENHTVQIALKSELGSGSIFAFALPIAPAL